MNTFENLKRVVADSAVASVLNSIDPQETRTIEEIHDICLAAVIIALDNYDVHTESRVRLIELDAKLRRTRLHTSPLPTPIFPSPKLKVGEIFESTSAGESRWYEVEHILENGRYVCKRVDGPRK